MRRIHLYQKRVYNRNKNTGGMISSTFNKSFNKNSILPGLGGMTKIKNVDKANCTKICNNNQKDIKLDCKLEYYIDLSDNITGSKLSADDKFINLLNVIPKGLNTSAGIVDNIYVSNVYWQNKNDSTDQKFNLNCIECADKSKYVKFMRVILVIDDKNCSGLFSVNPLTLTAGLIFIGLRIAYNPLSAGQSHGKSKFRRPVAGFRKAYAECDDMRQNKWNDGKNIYADNYARCKEKKVCRDYDCNGNAINTAVSRTNYPVVRSGMLERKDRQQFRSYRDYLHNGVLASYERSLEKNRMDTTASSKCQVFNKSVQCCDKPTGSCNCNASKRCSSRVLSKTIFKPNNKKFQVQGAVSSGSRLDRLKLDTIRKADANKVKKRKGGLKNKKTCDCNKSSCTDCGSSNGKCSDFVGTAPYFAGKPRFTGWIYNNLNPENRCNKRARPSPFGIPQHQKYRANSTYKTKGKITC
tara:strand:+ start:1694 stop:3094 length:1401 start_codon:yes stop_codon:yes gene_type:complete